MLRKQRHILIQKRFSSHALSLRQAFEENFANPQNPQRFCWDYWHVPDQYTLLRTPAEAYFERRLYFRFHNELIQWGRRTLGCWDISPPWMSNYVEGCRQELHSDVPHGPWAFVFSLSPKRPVYRGGETLLLKPETLQYWSHFSEARDRELTSFVDRIPSPFNQLTVFDPRYPHGVTELRGTQDPTEGRLVIHGWFTEPKTYTEGYLPKASTEKILNIAFQRVAELVQRSEPVQGVLSLQLFVRSSGTVSQVRFATSNLLNLEGKFPTRMGREILEIYRNLRFSNARGPTRVTIPLIVN